MGNLIHGCQKQCVLVSGKHYVRVPWAMSVTEVQLWLYHQHLCCFCNTLRCLSIKSFIRYTLHITFYEGSKRLHQFPQGLFFWLPQFKYMCKRHTVMLVFVLQRQVNVKKWAGTTVYCAHNWTHQTDLYVHVLVSPYQKCLLLLGRTGMIPCVRLLHCGFQGNLDQSHCMWCSPGNALTSSCIQWLY